jgi:hypothetical protein
MGFTIVIADNFHYMDESAYMTHGYFETLDAAIAAARDIVDQWLGATYKPGMTSDELYQQYMLFGEDPFVRGPEVRAETFSAWTYAEQRCAALCGAGGTDRETSGATS